MSRCRGPGSQRGPVMVYRVLSADGPGAGSRTRIGAVGSPSRRHDACPRDRPRCHGWAIDAGRGGNGRLRGLRHMRRMTVERERDGERRDDERRHGHDSGDPPPGDPPPGEHAGRRDAAVPALGSVVRGLHAAAIRPQHGTEPCADTPQQVGVTPQVVLQQRPADRDRRRRDVAPGARGQAHARHPTRAWHLKLRIAYHLCRRIPESGPMGRT
jgi:hypothetical protein